MGAMCGLPRFWTKKYPKSIYMKRPAVLDQRRHPKPFSLRWAQPWGPAGRDLSVAVRSRCPGVQRGMVGWTQLGFQVGIKFINLYKCLCFLRLSLPFSVRLVWQRFDSWQGSWSMLQHATTCYTIYSEPSLFLQASKIGAHTICSTCRQSHPQPVAIPAMSLLVSPCI